jgi:hypothetical protein
MTYSIIMSSSSGGSGDHGSSRGKQQEQATRAVQ